MYAVEQLGFTCFMPSREFYDQSRGYLANGTGAMNAEDDICRIIGHWVYDSIKEAVYICARNQVGTAYLDFLLQTSHHTLFFKNALPLNLSFKFSVAKKDLSRSFDRGGHHSCTEHEVQQFARHVLEKLEDKAKVIHLAWSWLIIFRSISSLFLTVEASVAFSCTSGAGTTNTHRYNNSVVYLSCISVIFFPAIVFLVK